VQIGNVTDRRDLLQEMRDRRKESNRKQSDESGDDNSKYEDVMDRLEKYKSQKVQSKGLQQTQLNDKED
jgi:hypothetical protein